MITGIAMGGRVVVAMSGGVDSSVTAALLAEAGHDVVGITLQLYDHSQGVGRSRACCAGQDIGDAHRVAERLGIPHYVLDYQARFRAAVMEPFAAAYAAGETPIPCVLCNQRIKFRDLLQVARDLGAAALATGHYVRRVERGGTVELHRGAEAARDQSYFLFATTRAELEYLRFPLGDLPKAEVRRLAARHGLAVAAKPDSQDICFVPGGRYAEVLAKLRPGAAEPGEIVDLEGRVLGHHNGVINFTVGQRKGLRLAAEAPLYVVRLEAEARRVVVGPRAALGRDRITLRGLNWLATDSLPQAAPVTVKLRSTQADAPARITALPGHGAVVELAAPELGVAPGQACVAYQGSRVLGGGWIAATEARGAALTENRPGLLYAGLPKAGAE